jgi:hypothetical protein
MSRRVKLVSTFALVILATCVLVTCAAAQLVRPGSANSLTDPTHTIQALQGMPELGSVLNRSCGACHSNEPVWPEYTKTAPLSWLVAYGETSGRRAVNFSEWSSYSPEVQRKLLVASCRDVSEGRMPSAVYIALRPDARLSAHDVETICSAAR